MSGDAERPGPAGDLIGTTLAGRYRIIARLGAGAMGAVYLGEHLHIGRRDAIKVLREGTTHDPESAARFMRGARIVSAIRHPNVCTIYDFSDTADGLQFLAMEYIEGESLKDTLDREIRLDLPRAAAIALQVAGALQAAHDAGIVHRDLKPGNIMVSPRADGTDAVKVVDFDIAKGPQEVEGEEVTRVGFVVGTPEYMSPEQLMGEQLDGRSDVYSLGIVLFRMLTGALPFRAASTQEIMVQRLTGTPLLLGEALPGATFAPALQRLIARALARTPADRQESAAAFAAELTAAVGAGAAVAAAPVARAVEAVPATVVTPQAAGPTGGAAVAPPARRNRTATIVGGVLVLAVLGVGATVLLRPGDGGADPTAAAAAAQQTDAAPPVTDREPAPGPAGPVTEPVPPAPRADTGGGPAHTPEPRSPVLPGSISEVLERQLGALSSGPTPPALRAIRDTATLAWNLATTRRDSAAAALTLAQAALTADDIPACANWAARAAALGAPGVDMLLQVCR